MRAQLLQRLIGVAMERRWIVWLTSIILTVALGAAGTLIEIDIRWSALLQESMPVVKEFKKIDNNFYQPGNMIVAISGEDPVMLEQITDEATALLQQKLVCAADIPEAECIAQERYARYVYGSMPQDWLTEHALRLTKPNDTRRMKERFSDPRLLPALVHLNDDFEMEYTDSENVKNQEREVVAALDAVQRFVETLDTAATEDVNDDRVERVVRDLTIGNPYMLALDNSMSLIMVSAAVSSDDMETLPLLDRRIEALLAPLNEKYPEYRLERTGITAVSRDEMDSIGPVTTMITVAAMVLVFLLLIWNFRSVLLPVLALTPIVAGIIWTVGVIGLTLGEMNLFTVMIMVILLGLGIDFSIHLTTRFHEEIGAGKSLERALWLTIGETGKGVITGALTTAAAFYTLMIAETKGISQFGFCAGTGVIITLLAVFWLLPALLTVAAMRHRKKVASSHAHDFSALGNWAVKMGQWRIPVVLLLILLTAAGIWGGLHLNYEWNFLELEPKGLRSIQLQDEIIDKYKLSISVSILTADSLEESRDLRKQFKEKPIVGEVDDISLWISRPDFEESRPHIQELQDLLEIERPVISFTQPQTTDDDEFAGMSLEERQAMLADELDRLWANIVEIQALSFIGGQDRVVEKATRLVATRENRDDGLLRRVADRFLANEDLNWESVDRFALRFDASLQARVAQMAQGDEPVDLAMAPEDIRAKYVSKTGMDGYLLQILPKQNLYEREELTLFQEVAAKVHPNVTGMPQMILQMGLATIREGKWTSLAAICMILALLLVDFRKRPLVAGFAFLPLIVGIALMLGVMWLSGEKLNYMNIIALPVIIGIGVDDGVHFFHRLLQEGKGRLKHAVTSVGRAMLMTSLTTMIGFGSLMFYLMEGMKSMGFALFIGVGLCFIVTVTLLPALAVMFEKWILKEPQVVEKTERVEEV